MVGFSEQCDAVSQHVVTTGGPRIKPAALLTSRKTEALQRKESFFKSCNSKKKKIIKKSQKLISLVFLFFHGTLR